MKCIYIYFSFLVLTILGVQNSYSQACTTTGTISIGPSGTYATLTAAIANLNTNGIGGSVILELQTTYNPTSETYPLVLKYIPCASATNTVTIRPSSSVSSTFTWTSAAAQTIRIDSGRFYKIDGRPGGTGTNNFLIIENTSTSGVALQFQNDAVFNQIRNSIIQGVNTTTTIGTVLFSTTTGTLGNSNNRIEFCNIGNGSTNPVHTVYSSGTASAPNIRNVLYRNNIYNFQGGTSYGFYSSANGSRWIIDSNSFYQTANTVAANQTRIIYIAGTDSNYIRNNFIGGNAPFCAGTWSSSTATASNASRIVAIWMDGSTNFASHVDNNTIQNFTLYTTSGGSAGPGIFCGVYTTAGNVNIGLNAGNTIGNFSSSSIVGTTSTSITTGSNYGILGISTTSTGNNIIKNNSIGGMTLTGTTATIVARMRGIVNTGASGQKLIENNVIGGNLNNSLSVGLSGTTTVANELYGIESAGAGVVTIKGNTISNLTSYSNASTAAVNIAIQVSAGTDTIVENKISKLINSSNDGPRGIRLASLGHFVAYNHIDSLIQTNGGSTNGIIGIINNGGTGSATIAYNVIQNLLIDPAISSGGFIIGLSINQAGTYNVYNNTIALGLSSQIVNASSLAGIKIPNASGSLVLKNNIIYLNTSPLSWAACIQNTTSTTSSAPAVSLFSASNNLYYINDGASNFIYTQGTTPTAPAMAFHSCSTCPTSASIIYDPVLNTSCSLYKAFMSSPRESNTAFELPVFTGGVSHPTNLIPNPSGSSFLQNNGTSVGFTRDYFNNSVSVSTPDIGASEFSSGNVMDLTPPSISYTNLPNLNCPSAVSLAATITDASGIKVAAGSRPRLYYKKSTDVDVYGSNSSSVSGWKYVEASNSVSPFNFSMDFSILNGASMNPGDTIQYFVVAVDSSPMSNFAINSATLSPTVCLNNVDMNLSGVSTTTGTKQFYLNASPSLSITKSPSTMCLGDTVTLTATTGATSYSWTSNKTGATVLGTSNVLKHQTPDSPTVYTCTIVHTGCTYMRFDTVRPYKLPKMLKAIDSIQCGAGVPKCKVSDSNAFSSRMIRWYSSTTSTSPLQSGTDSTYLSSISSTTIFYVSIAHPTTGCMSPRVAVNAVITVADSISAKINNIKDSFATCLGIPLSLTSANIQQPSTTTTYTSYTWSASGSGSGISTPISNGTGSQTITPTSSGLYTLTVTATNGFCTSTKTIKLNALVTPTAINIVQDSIVICKGSLGSLHATGALIGATSSPKTWSPSTGLYSNSTGTIPYSSPVDTVYPKPNITSWYFASYTHSSGCMTKDSAKVIVIDTVSIGTHPVALKTLCIGDTLKLIASATSSSTLSKQWRKNGSNITGNTTATKDTLIIVTSSLADSGVYDIVWNTTSPCSPKVSTSCIVKINSPIVISTQPPAKQSVCKNSSVNMNIAASNYSSMQWLKNGTPVSTGTGGTTQSYVLNPVALSDTGIYSVLLTGNTPCPNLQSSNDTLSVTPLASISSPPSAMKICQSDTMKMNVIASHALGYQWQLNGNNIGINANAYTKSNAQISDSGYYRVIVLSANGCPSDTSISVLGAVKKAIQILTQPSALSYGCLGSSFSLSVAASEYSSLMWYKNTVSTGITSSVFSVSSFAISDTGQYYVRFVGNSPCPSLNSSIASVLSTGAAQITSDLSAVTNSCIGSTIKLKVIATAAQSYQWYKNGTPISGANADSLVITNSTAIDSGMYRVVAIAYNGCTNDTSLSTRVIMNVPITMTSIPTMENKCEGGTISLSVNVSGTGPYNYTWYQDGTIVSTTPSLTISNILSSHSGKYKVAVQGSSSCPMVQSNIDSITVNKSPRISIQVSKNPVCLNESYTFSADTALNYTSIKWYGKMTSTLIDSGLSFVRSSALVADSGYYYAIASPLHGCVSKTSDSILFRVQIPVSITSQPIGAILDDDLSSTHTMSVYAIGSGILTYQWYKNGVPISGAVFSSFTIAGFVASLDTGQYYCAVTSPSPCNNTVNSAPCTIQVRICPNILYHPVTLVKICAKDSFQLKVKALGVKSYQWYKDNQPILGANLPTYNVPNANPTHSGRYQCRLIGYHPSFSCDTMFSDTSRVIVKDKPTITLPLKSNPNCSYSTHTMNIAADFGDKFEWYRNGVLFMTTSQGSPSSYTFNNVNAIGDVFYVVASNEVCPSTPSNSILLKKIIPTNNIRMTDTSLFNLVEKCTDSLGWTYYTTTPLNEKLYFAIKKNTNVFTANPDIEVLTQIRDIDPNNVEKRGAILGSRIFNTDINGAVVAPYDIKFYYTDLEESLVNRRYLDIKKSVPDLFSKANGDSMSVMYSKVQPFTKQLWNTVSIPLHSGYSIANSSIEKGVEGGMKYVIIKNLTSPTVGGTFYMDYFLKSSSSVRSVEHLDVQIFPNPIEDGLLKLRIRAEKKGQLQMSIVDISGREVAHFAENQTQLEKDYVYAVSHLSKGSYQLVLTNGETQWVGKLVIQH